MLSFEPSVLSDAPSSREGGIALEGRVAPIIGVTSSPKTGVTWNMSAPVLPKKMWVAASCARLLTDRHQCTRQLNGSDPQCFE